MRFGTVGVGSHVMRDFPMSRTACAGRAGSLDTLPTHSVSGIISKPIIEPGISSGPHCPHTIETIPGTWDSLGGSWFAPHHTHTHT
jgi:hypothetical protein